METPSGRYLAQWETERLAEAVADMFGYHAVQLGLPNIDALGANRMPHRFVGAQSPEEAAHPRVGIITDMAALPFASGSIDLVVLPHTLELSADPHATLREVERVLVPEGRVVICGLNPLSLWSWRQRRARLMRRLGLGSLFLPEAGEFMGYWRIRDWLRLLNFEVESGQFGCFRPALRSEAWLQRFAWMDRLGAKWWPILGAVYCVVAVKRMPGMRLLGPAWKASRRLAGAPVGVSQRGQNKVMVPAAATPTDNKMVR